MYNNQPFQNIVQLTLVGMKLSSFLNKRPTLNKNKLKNFKNLKSINSSKTDITFNKKMFTYINGKNVKSISYFFQN